MKKLANYYKLVVIVGGDFKIEVIEWKTNIEKEFHGCYKTLHGMCE